MSHQWLTTWLTHKWLIAQGHKSPPLCWDVLHLYLNYRNNFQICIYVYKFLYMNWCPHFQYCKTGHPTDVRGMTIHWLNMLVWISLEFTSKTLSSSSSTTRHFSTVVSDSVCLNTFRSFHANKPKQLPPIHRRWGIWILLLQFSLYLQYLDSTARSLQSGCSYQKSGGDRAGILLCQEF